MGHHVLPPSPCIYPACECVADHLPELCITHLAAGIAKDLEVLQGESSSASARIRRGCQWGEPAGGVGDGCTASRDKTVWCAAASMTSEADGVTQVCSDPCMHSSTSVETQAWREHPLRHHPPPPTLAGSLRLTRAWRVPRQEAVTLGTAPCFLSGP
jgi:hypothetical protein